MGDLYAEIPFMEDNLVSSFPKVKADATEERTTRATMWLKILIIGAVVAEVLEEVVNVLDLQRLLL